MKKWIVLTTLLLSACTPHVTVTSEVTVTSTPLPSETPIPTPTLHPDFVALQEQIAATGKRFTLNGVNGLIYDGETPISGLNIAPDGTVTLTVDGEEMVLEKGTYTFDDENGFTVDGYELNADNKWTEAQSPEEKQFNDDMKKWGINLETEDKDSFEKRVTENGETILVDKKTEKVLYRNGSWEPLFLGEMITDSKMCKITDWSASKIGPGTPGDLKSYMNEYSQPLVDAYLLFVDKKIIPSSGVSGRSYYLGNGCWAMIFHSSENQNRAWYFWKDTVGRPMYEKVFLTTDK